jgi:hypothetical protein
VGLFFVAIVGGKFPHWSFLMDLKSTLDHHKRVTQQREDDERQQESQRLKDEQTRRRLNAGKVAQHLREVVRPVLENAQEEIRTAGYSCEVVAYSKRDPDISEEEQTFALCLKMTVEKGGMSNPAWLQYAGESDGTALTITECPGNSARPMDVGMRSLSLCNREYVEGQVEDLVKVVFRT